MYVQAEGVRQKLELLKQDKCMKIFIRTGRMRNLSDDDIQHTLSLLNINPPLPLSSSLLNWALSNIIVTNTVVFQVIAVISIGFVIVSTAALILSTIPAFQVSFARHQSVSVSSVWVMIPALGGTVKLSGKIIPPQLVYCFIVGTEMTLVIILNRMEKWTTLDCKS